MALDITDQKQVMIMQANVIARAFLSIYKKDHGMDEEWSKDIDYIYNQLTDKVRYYLKKGVDVQSIVELAYNEFQSLDTLSKNDLAVKAIPFTLRLIIKYKPTNNKLLNACLREDRRWFLNKELEVKYAKELIDKWYELKESM